MFTKEDYEEYFRDINTKEQGMAKNLEDVLPLIGDKVITANIKNVLKDELRHVGLTVELKKLLDK